MILACPSCRTRYVVPDSAIGSTGRRVRCAQCKFSWFQDGPELAEALPARGAAATTADAVRERIKPAPLPEQAWRDPVPKREAEAPAPPLPEPPVAPAPEWSEPAYEEERRRPRRRYRRNPARMWTFAAVFAAVLMSAAVVAIWWIGPQQLVAWMGGEATPAAEERLGLSGRARRENLPSNQELVTVTGEVRNLTGETQRVPQIRAQLVDAQQRVVFTWLIAPPVQELGPRETVTFEGASTGVPRGGANLSLSFGPQS